MFEDMKIEIINKPSPPNNIYKTKPLTGSYLDIFIKGLSRIHDRISTQLDVDAINKILEKNLIPGLIPSTLHGSFSVKISSKKKFHKWMSKNYRRIVLSIREQNLQTNAEAYHGQVEYDMLVTFEFTDET